MAVYRMIKCGMCGHETKIFWNPYPTVDVIIEVSDGIVLIERVNKPHGFALPGGFVDYGETLESAAIREAYEETGLMVDLRYVLGVYSDPKRDPRFHTISTVFIGVGNGKLSAGDDARNAIIIDPSKIKERGINLVFDHEKIVDDYLSFKLGKRGAIEVIKHW